MRSVIRIPGITERLGLSSRPNRLTADHEPLPAPTARRAAGRAVGIEDLLDQPGRRGRVGVLELEDLHLRRRRDDLVQLRQHLVDGVKLIKGVV